MAANLQKFSNLSLKRKKCLQIWICRHFCMDRRVFKRQKDYTRPALFFRYLQLNPSPQAPVSTVKVRGMAKTSTVTNFCQTNPRLLLRYV